MKKLFLFFSFLFATHLMAEYVDIKAEHFYASDIKKKAFFEGNAHIVQGENRIDASKVIVFFNDKKKALKYEASGNVSFDLIENGTRYQGEAQLITYLPTSSEYRFSGDVVLKDLSNDRTIKAESIILDLKTGFAEIQGRENKPVHFRFEIEERQ